MGSEMCIRDRIFDLGSKYQLELITKGQAIEVAQSIADQLTSTLELDHPIEPLAFLAESSSTLATKEQEFDADTEQEHQDDQEQ